MSEFKTDKIRPVDAGSTTTLGESGDTIATGSGTTLDIQGTYSGINAISWDTTAKTANFTAETNKGYFINTTSGGVTITLPATPVAGSFIGIKDYALTAQTNNITINPNGNKIQGTTANATIETQGGSANLVYVDATQGWLTFDAAQASDIAENKEYISATGGTVTTCGDFKIHTFTGPGTFCVSCAGNAAGSNTVDYMIVAGGGGGAGGCGAGHGAGGAGGFRTSATTYCGPSLANCVSALPVSVQGYPVTVGAGGATIAPSPASTNGNSGSDSIFSTITSAGGGGGAFENSNAKNGGSGGGKSYSPTGSTGTGNTPPVSPPQGNPGGLGGGPGSGPGFGGAGGGGANSAGGNAPGGGPGGTGGAGEPNAISGSATTYAGGGGGGSRTSGGSGGAGGGGTGSSGPTVGTNGTTNTGGGGGGGSNLSLTGPGGGSGIVVIRYRYQ